MAIDFFQIVFWWFLIFAIGLAFLPLTRFFFKKFFDRGYAFSKVIGLLFVTYLVWLFGSLKIFPFTHQSIWLAISVGVIFNLALAKSGKTKIKKIIKGNWKIFAFEESLFLGGLVFWSLVRGFQPDIQGLEKYMDFSFINSILRTTYFPPADVWLAGETINYYYFGHLVTALITRLSNINSTVTYNLMIATIFGLSLSSAFSFGSNLVSLIPKLPVKRKRLIFLSGTLTAYLLTIGGNLHAFWWYLKNRGFESYWYPDATRFIVEKFGAGDNTIHEFPIYSFVVADLHGHLLNLPFVLLFLGLILSVVFQKKFNRWSYLAVGFLLAIFYMTNTWDFPIYLLVFGAINLWFNYLESGFSLRLITKTFISTLSVLVVALMFSLPFHLHFKSIAQGISLVDFHSPGWMLLVLWGFPLIITLLHLFWIVSKKVNPLSRKVNPAIFVLILLAIAWFLILVPEVFYLKDIYIHSHQRANTMFKLTYQSFVIFSLISPFIVINILLNLKLKWQRGLLLIAIAPLLFFIFKYSHFAVGSYYGLKNYRGLDGLKYFNQLYPNDYQAILWLRKNIENQPVLVEAVGESYTNYARISANTGLPTILGWRVHEWLWRGSFDQPGKRTDEVRLIYESPEINETKQLLNHHQAVLIFVGDLERQQYPSLDQGKFETLGEVIFSSGETKIYRINN